MQEIGIPRIGNFNLTHHLADDTFDMLIGDGHTLQAIDSLDFVYQVTLHRFGALHSKNIVRIHGTVANLLASAYTVAFENRQVTSAGNENAGFFIAVFDDNLLVAAFFVAVRNDTVDRGDDRDILRNARFEKLCDTGKTTGNILGLSDCARELRENFARFRLVAFMNRQNGSIRQVVNALALAARIDNVYRRTMLTVAVADDSPRFHAGHIVLINTVSRVFNQIDKLDFTARVAENGLRIRIPFKELGILFDRIAIIYIKRCAIRNLPTALVDSGRVKDDQFAHPAHHDLVAVMFERIDVIEFNPTIDRSALRIFDSQTA